MAPGRMFRDSSLAYCARPAPAGVFHFWNYNQKAPLRSMCRPRSPRPGGRCKLRSIESWVLGRWFFEFDVKGQSAA
jgi:hypothetical protein